MTLHYITLFFTTNYIAVPYRTVQYSTVQYSMLVELITYHFDKTLHQQHVTSTVHDFNNILRDAVVATFGELIVMAARFESVSGILL